MTKKEKLIYLAGIIDGEGTFFRVRVNHFRGGKNNPNAVNNPGVTSGVCVVQKERELLDWIKENFGGSVVYVNRLSYGKRRPCWRWDLRGYNAEALAFKLRPYMIVKKEQIKRVIYTEAGYIPRTTAKNLPVTRLKAMGLI